MTEATILLAAMALDLLLGELPASVHPVVWVGRLIATLERIQPRGRMAQLVYGALIVCAGVVAVVAPAWLLLNWLKASAWLVYVLLGTVLLKSTFSIRGLLVAAETVRVALVRSDLPGARLALRSLVSRDTSQLDEPLLAAAAVESVAENSSDSFVAPLFYFTLFGVPGALFYRVVNTYDSMIGYHGRYEYLGKFAARLDDVLNLIPARLTGLLLVAACPLARAPAGEAWRTMLRDHSATESPNAGWPMAAMAGALRVRLEKVGHYRLGVEYSAPSAASIGRANAVAYVALRIAAVLAIVLLVLRDAYGA